jgi:transposase
MRSIVLTPPQRQVFIRQMKRETKPSRRLRMHIILLCADGHSPSQIARVLYCSRTTVYTTARRFLQAGEAAFADQRPRGPVPTLDQLA